MTEDTTELISRKIKHFDDIFRTFFLVITITISIGLNAFEEISLWSLIGLLLIPLVWWMLGHAIGSYSILKDIEVSLKLMSWAFACLLALIIFLKFGFVAKTLSYEWVGVCVFSSLALTYLPYRWLREPLSESKRRKFWLILLLTLIMFSVGVNNGTINV